MASYPLHLTCLDLMPQALSPICYAPAAQMKHEKLASKRLVSDASSDIDGRTNGAKRRR